MARLPEGRRLGLLGTCGLFRQTLKPLGEDVTAPNAVGTAAQLYGQLTQLLTITEELLREHVVVDVDDAPRQATSREKEQLVKRGAKRTRTFPTLTRAPKSAKGAAPQFGKSVRPPASSKVRKGVGHTVKPPKR